MELDLILIIDNKQHIDISHYMFDINLQHKKKC